MKKHKLFYIAILFFLSACGTYTTKRDGNLIYIEHSGSGIPVQEVLLHEVHKQCPSGYEYMGYGVKTGIVYHKYKCL